ncbi:hypothetical protein BKA70DRAFT_1184130 [Coprinopsis sp. MPI-PUGE-AT-0042]|nr:hypothetical protein BKA70DRAFT_1184130 [Coprinopsis sp. MPI-PUGE-AT-0042]
MRSDTPRVFIIVDDSTICEPRDQQEERRDRKRRRADDDREKAGVAPEASFESLAAAEKAVFKQYERDEEYYVGPVQDDEHVVCLRNTLYKVRRDMVFKSQNHRVDSDRWTDENPLRIHLHVSPEEFKALLWAIEMPKEDLAHQPKDYRDVDMIVNLAMAARPFGLEDVRTWALGVVQRAVDDDVFMASCNSSTLARIVEVAHYCHKLALVPAVAAKWHERLLAKTAPAVPAMHISERFNLKELKGMAYYRYLMEMAEGQDAGTDGVYAPLRVNEKVNNGQTMRLLAGYMSLTKYWERFRSRPLDLPLGSDCSDDEHKACVAAWGKRWNSVIGWKRTLNCSSADVLAGMKALQDQLSNDESFGKDGLRPSCKLAGLKAIQGRLEVVEKNMGAHFSGCV